MRYESIITERGRVDFPEFQGDRHYMIPYVPERWRRTVDQMLDGFTITGPVYLMVDETFVPAGWPQRRPGLHIDGYWNPGRGGHGEHASLAGHTPRHLPVGPGHGPARRHVPGGGGHIWQSASFADKEAIFLATNIEAARGYVGTFDGPVGDGGDCSHIDVSSLTVVDFAPNRTVCGNVVALHESIAVKEDCFRQLVRLNVPGL